MKLPTDKKDLFMLNYFDKIYIINLETRTDRLEEIKLEFDKIGINLPHPKINIFKVTKPTSNEGWPTIGTKGCFLSHLSVLQDARMHKYEQILVLEDDVNFIEHFNTSINNVIAQLKAVEWNIFYGGYRVSEQMQLTIEPPHHNINEVVYHKLHTVTSSTEVLCNHFVALNKEAIVELSDYLQAMIKKPSGDPSGGPMHVDGAYSWFRKQHPHIQTFLSYPELGYQRSSRTDIHDLKWFDKLPILNVATSALRKIKNQVIYQD